jgi:hypothetical protein
MRTTTTTRAKRSTLILLALLASLGLMAGCGSSDSGSDGASNGASDETTTIEEGEATVEVSIVEIETTTTSAPAETTTTDQATTTTTAAPKAVIGKIQFATRLEANGTPIDPTDTFSTDEDVIYASVLMTSLPKGTTVQGGFSVDGAALSDNSQDAPADYTEVYVQFALRSGGTFEPGTYSFDVSAGDEKAETVTFTVS